MTGQAVGTLVVIVGLPGSGKSALIEDLKQQHDQVEVYDDYQGGAYGDFSDPRLSRHFGPMLRDLLSGKRVVVADIAFCSRPTLNLFLGVVLSAVPSARWAITYFENDPQQCQTNCLARNRNLDSEYANIARFTPLYDPPRDARPVYRPVVD